MKQDEITKDERYRLFVSLITQHQRSVHAYVFAMLKDVALTDDVMQETALAMWENFSTFEAGTHFVAWACKIAHNRILNLRRKLGRDRHQYGTAFEQVMAEKAASATDEMDEERRIALANCLEKLSDSSRSALLQCYERGATIRSVAERLGKKPKALYKLLARWRMDLFECVERRLIAGQEDPQRAS